MRTFLAGVMIGVLCSARPPFKHKVARSVGEKLQNDSDPKRPDVFDDWQHRPSGVLFLVE